MSNKTKSNKTKPESTVNPKAIAAIDAALSKAVGEFIGSFATLSKAVRDAVDAYKAAGLDDKATASAVKAVFEKAGSAKAVNAHLRAAGVRQRGLRCDAGIDGLMLKFGAKAKAKASEPAERTPAERLSASALRVADGDKAKAIAALKAAILALEAAE